MISLYDLGTILECLVLYENTMAEAAVSALTEDSRSRYTGIANDIGRAIKAVKAEQARLEKSI